MGRSAQRSQRKSGLFSGGAGSRHRPPALGVPDRAPRPVGLRRALAADPRRSHRRRRAGAGAGAAHQAGRTVRARSPHRPTGAPGQRVARATRRRQRRPHGAHPAGVCGVVRSAAADRLPSMWGATPLRPARLSHRVSPPALRRPLHAALRRRHARCIPATSASSTGAASRSIPSASSPSPRRATSRSRRNWCRDRTTPRSWCKARKGPTTRCLRSTKTSAHLSR
jgi:hypothetical protein